MSAPQTTLKVPKSKHFGHIFLLGLVKQFFFTEKPKKQALCISMAEPPLPLTVSLTVKYPFFYNFPYMRILSNQKVDIFTNKMCQLETKTMV